MLAIINSLVINGIDAMPVKVEVDILGGLPNFEVVGLASTAVKEARERVRSALKNSGYEFPNRRLTVNLAPADIKKEGSHFDLPIAVGILLASGQIAARIPLEHMYFAGELSLNGDVRSIPGSLSMVLALLQQPPACLVIPAANAGEAALVTEIPSYGVSSLQQLAAYMTGQESLFPAALLPPPDAGAVVLPDFAEVQGQETAKRAIQVAAAGRHNILLIGSPGGGKTMLARRIPGILPPMKREEVLETTRIYSVAGLLEPGRPLIHNAPFRAPHKNASSASIIGGGRVPRPGEISLAHNGVLFLDEMPEFSRDVLESLRQPLEDRIITVARVASTLTYPADFMLVGAMNPCPCGNFGSDKECTCSPQKIQIYLKRISGPLLDRIDLHVEIPRVNYAHLRNPGHQLDSAQMQAAVVQARAIQATRLEADGMRSNAQMQTRQLQEYCQLDPAGETLLKNAFTRLKMSARSYTRILKVARTIADLEGETAISVQHLAEALQYRSLDQKYWPH